MTVETARAIDVADEVIGLAFSFARTAIANPTILNALPSGLHLAIIPDDDPELAEALIAHGIATVRRGENVYFLHVHREAEGTLSIKRSTS